MSEPRTIQRACPRCGGRGQLHMRHLRSHLDPLVGAHETMKTVQIPCSTCQGVGAVRLFADDDAQVWPVEAVECLQEDLALERQCGADLEGRLQQYEAWMRRAKALLAEIHETQGVLGPAVDEVEAILEAFDTLDLASQRSLEGAGEG